MSGSKFKEGDLVGFLHEQGRGKVLRFERGFYIVEDNDGFEKKCRETELIEIHGSDFPLSSLAFEKMKADSVKKKSVEATKIVVTSTGRKKRSLAEWEIDIHAEELNINMRGMTNHDILTEQLKALKNFHEKAMKKEIKRLVIIHGVGEGVLREEVRSYFLKFFGTRCIDADIEEYGKGATEVFLSYE